MVIHLHDIFLPDDYPDDWVFNRKHSWNEQYVLQAFLQHNSNYVTLLANAFLYKNHREKLDQLFHGIQPSHGVSWWMQKMR